MTDRPAWLMVGALVTLPRLDVRTWKANHVYRVVHIKPNRQMWDGVEVGVQPIDHASYKNPKCVNLGHCQPVGG